MLTNKGCPLEVPADLSMASSAASSVGGARRENSDAWTAAIVANQFPVACEQARWLLFEDDITGQGLGYSANYYASLLLIAQQNRRILAEVPLNVRWPSQPPFVNGSSQYSGTSIAYHPSGLKPATAPRWCDRPPYTLQCFFRPLTHCQIPADDRVHIAPVPRFRNKFLPWYRLTRLGYGHASILRVK